MKKYLKKILPSPFKEYLLEYNRRQFCKNKYLKLEKPNPGKFYSYNAFDYYRCIFIHIPKAAGVSFNLSLFGNYGGGHKTLKFYEDKYPKHTIKEYYKFTVVRNPWDRLYSAFTFLKKGGFDYKDRDWAKSNLSDYETFEEFVLNWVNEENIYKKIHFIPQYEFLMDRSNKINIDYVGRFEDMENTFTVITKKLGINSRLEKKNVTERRNHYSDQYTEEMKAIVSSVYARDIKEFKYNFLNSK